MGATGAKLRASGSVPAAPHVTARSSHHPSVAGSSPAGPTAEEAGEAVTDRRGGAGWPVSCPRGGSAQRVARSASRVLAHSSSAFVWAIPLSRVAVLSRWASPIPRPA